MLESHFKFTMTSTMTVHLFQESKKLESNSSHTQLHQACLNALYSYNFRNKNVFTKILCPKIVLAMLATVESV